MSWTKIARCTKMREIWQICESREKDVARIVSPGRNLPAFSLLSDISKLQYREFRARRPPLPWPFPGRTASLKPGGLPCGRWRRVFARGGGLFRERATGAGGEAAAAARVRRACDSLPAPPDGDSSPRRPADCTAGARHGVHHLRSSAAGGSLRCGVAGPAARAQECRKTQAPPAG